VRVLVVNAGSTSLKLAVVEHGERVARTDLHELDLDGLTTFIEREGARIDAVGHRVVHGGERFDSPARLDADVLRTLDDLSDLAPLHNGPALAAADTARRALGGVPHVACFDTAFHAGLPPEARTLAVPAEWREGWGVRRFGFHGLSHGWTSRRVAELAGPGLRLVSAHLGAGVSLCAVADGVSVDTTMGFTPTDGLVMATRSGSIDPGALTWAMRHHGLDADEVDRALTERAGLLGLSGRTGRMEELEAAATGVDAGARLAIGVYLHSLRAGIAAMAAALGGIEALAFTGGVGEHSPAVRAGACAGLGFLGVGLDEAANAAAGVGEETELSSPEAPVRVFVVPAREDLRSAAEVEETLEAGTGP